MQLKDWFTNLREQHLSKKEKASVYARILHKTENNKHFFTKRLEFYLKVGSLTTILLGGAVYFVTGYVPQSIQNGLTNNNSVVINNFQNSNLVHADTLGKLINVVGSIEIFDGSKKIPFTDEIFNGHTVTLGEGARVELVVRQGVKAIITGPAQFSLERLDDGTVVLNLIEGSYFEIVPVQTAEKNIFNGNIEESLQSSVDTKVDNLIVKTQDFEIQQMPAQRNLRVKVTKDEHGTSILENQGADIIIKRLEDNTETDNATDSPKSRLTVLGRDQVALVNKNITTGEVSITQSESDEIENQLRDRQLTIRYEAEDDITTVDTIRESSSNTGSTAAGVASTAAILATQENGESNLQSAENNKIVLDKATTQELQEIIKISFIKKHVTDIAVYQFNGNDLQKQVALDSLAGIINRARGVVGLSASGEKSIEGVIQSTNELAGYIDSTYFAGPTVTQTFTRITNIIVQLQGVPYNQTDTVDYQSIVEELNNQGFSVENL